ncbi:MAG: 50S ribosomal protein L3 [Candidatus Sumerlaeota bacterium]|nr:50S ribosomal protein L3 [Candidatus Sumerlaeota bacterium]
MPIGLLGKKVGMSQMFDDRGTLCPVTLIQAGPCPILQIKSEATDEYTAVQLGFDAKPESRANKAEVGHLKKARVAAPTLSPVRVKREFRVEGLEGFDVGGTLDVTLFAAGERVDVIGTSKGRGFAGSIKRHHTRRGPETHGSMYHRRVGSMGASSYPSRTFKGKKMGGHMGVERVTTKNVLVVLVDKEKNLLAVRGSVPGHNNAYVMIRKIAPKFGKEKA